MYHLWPGNKRNT